ncbi:MAG: M1 family metallopeptidase [Psychroflexus sp.]
MIQKKNFLNLFIIFLTLGQMGFAQQKSFYNKDKEGHTNQNKFRQLYDEFATPNMYRTASGAPGHAYYQNTADYVMNITLDDKNAEIYGEETITYTNNSPDQLRYLWLQLDQNVRSKDSKAHDRNSSSFAPITKVESFASQHMPKEFDGGFNIEYVKQNGQELDYTINFTMMRVEMAEPLMPGESFEFSVKWNYKLIDHTINNDRSGYEYFKKDDNRAYVIAQFFPRMVVYNDKEGWQNYQFWGAGEYALPFGDYDVKITVPSDHIMDATGKLQNRKKVFSRKMMERYEEAKKSYDEPVVIVTEEEAIDAEKNNSRRTKTWEYKAENVRDFAFASSRKFIWDMMNVKIGDKDVMAASLYPKEGKALWEKWGTRAVASTLKSYSKYTFDYPYHKAVAVHAKDQGMEYPMISWNHGRPEENGNISDKVRTGMVSVIIHETGHNFFPMIVNSDERQWGWMDEGLNTFLQYLTEQNFGKEYPEVLKGKKQTLDKFPSRRGEPSKIVNYMKGDQEDITPIMTNPENVKQLGNNAYGKTTTALNILRETVMGPELFDYAFREYAQRWMFKHPTPEDFFRTMEDASGVDLDWFWRGWFYTTDYVDIGVESVSRYVLTSTPTEEGKALLKRFGIRNPDKNPKTKNSVYLIDLDSEKSKKLKTEGEPFKNAPNLQKYLEAYYSDEEMKDADLPKYIYEITFNKPGGLVMPLIVKYTYADKTSEIKRYPVQVWRKNDKTVTKAILSQKKIIKIEIDPNLETADIDTKNNVWPR